MFRRWGMLILVTGATLAAAVVRPSHAELIILSDDFPDWRRCAIWTPARDKPGTFRRVYPVMFVPSIPDKHRRLAGESLDHRRGYFEFPSGVVWALLGNANGEGLGFPIGDKASVQFTLSIYDAILFHPDDDRSDRRPVTAIGGFVELSQTFLDKIRDVSPATCVQSATTAALEEKSLSDLAGRDAGKKTPASEPNKKFLAGLAGDGDGKTPEPSADPGKSLGDLGSKEPAKEPVREPAKEPSKPSPPKADVKPDAKPDFRHDAAEPAPRDVAGKDAKPPLRSPAGTSAVCSIETLRPLPVANGLTLRPWQTVGLRNAETEAEKFDYVAPPADAAIALNATLDLADSRARLVPYDTVAVTGSRDNADLWVSLIGVDEHRAGVRDAAAKSELVLRVIIVGGPAEIAMSGLAEVGAELKKQSGGHVKLDIEWDAVDATGSIAPAGRYGAFDKLVKAAAEKGAGAGPDLLNEMQLQRLLDDFERLLKERREPVEKIVWVKGAYSIPSSIPSRFERFIRSASASEAIGGASGRPGKWLVLVTARMTGFSINYLKEPIYSLQIGDVVEEEDTPAGQPRRLIRDVGLLATRLRLAAVPAPAPGAVSGKLVLKAAEVFDSRGYLLSPESLAILRDHLKLVANRWDEWGPSQERLAYWAGLETRKPAPTVADLLQNADDVSYPRLPRYLPDWTRKAIRTLTDAEVDSARRLIDGYRDGAAGAVGRISDAKSERCGFFYAPETLFGFDKP